MELTRRTKWLMTGAMALGAAVGAAGIAGAATTSTSSTANSAATAPAAATAPDPSQVSHGPNETLLTGTTADKVTAAAKTAVSGGTIIRVETDSDGAAYEAHVRKADGTYVTVKLDSAFKVTETVDGNGSGPGGHGPGGPGGYGTPSG